MKSSTPETIRNDTLVVRFSPVWLAIAMLMGVIGAAYVGYGYVHGGRFPLGEESVPPATIMVIAAIALPFYAITRIQIDTEEIRQYRGKRLVRRASIRTIREISVGMQKKILRFEGGETFVVHDSFQNAAEAVAFFRAVLDARAAVAAIDVGAANNGPLERFSPAAKVADAAGASPVVGPVQNTLTLPVQYVSFPPRCCGCGRPAADGQPVVSSQILWFLLFSLQQSATVFVPVCNWCKWKRRVGGVLSLLFLAVTFTSGFGAGIFLCVCYSVPIGLAGLFVFLVSMIVLIRSYDSLLDRFFIGVRATGMSKDLQTITLRFRDTVMAEEVAELTEQRRKSQLVAAAKLLREPAPK